MPELRAVRWLLVAVASAMSFAQILTAQPLQSANDRSRWATVWALVERGTLQIDEIDARPNWTTIDKVRHDGHFYSSKPPLQSVVVAGVYWCVKRTTGWNLDDHTTDVCRLTLLIVNGLPRVLMLIVVAWYVEKHARTEFARWLVLIAACWGTLLNPFVSSLNNHFPGAVVTLLTLYALQQILMCGDRRKRQFALAGFASAVAFCCELPAALLLLVCGLLLLVHGDWRRTLLAFVPAAAIPVVAYGVTNWLVTGGAMPFYSSYGSDKYVYEHLGIPSYWSNPQGLDRNLDSPLMYFVHCTIGHHGLLSLTPLWLLTVIGWVRWRRWSSLQPAQRMMLLLGAVMTAIVLGFFMTRTQNYNYGGNSVALRWMLWLTPFWLMALIPVCDEWGSRRWFQLTSSGLLVISALSAGLPGGNPWQHPWLFTWMEDRGWIDYEMPPPPFEFNRPLWTWFSKPTEGFMEFRGTGSRLLDVGSNDSTPGECLLRMEGTKRGDNLFQLRFRNETAAADSSDQTDIYLDPADFLGGKKSSEFLRNETGGRSSRDQIVVAQRLITGLPQSVEFRSGHIRYLLTPLRPDKAFRCQRAATQVLFQPPHATQALRYRCDIWLCDELPFGVAQIELTVTDPGNGQTLMSQRLTVTAASGFENPTTPTADRD